MFETELLIILAKFYQQISRGVKYAVKILS